MAGLDYALDTVWWVAETGSKAFWFGVGLLNIGSAFLWVIAVWLLLSDLDRASARPAHGDEASKSSEEPPQNDPDIGGGASRA